MQALVSHVGGSLKATQGGSSHPGAHTLPLSCVCQLLLGIDAKIRGSVSHHMVGVLHAVDSRLTHTHHSVHCGWAMCTGVSCTC